MDNEKELNENKTEKDNNPVMEYVDKLKKENEAKAENNQAKPDYLLPQFKNIEEQAKSYKELQALQTKQSQELAELKKNKEANEQKFVQNDSQCAQKSIAEFEKQKIQNMYNQEINNLSMALKMGKISEKEAAIFVSQLKNFTVQKLQNLDYKLKNMELNNNQAVNMLSPKDYFNQDLATMNYLEPICEFLEKNYKKMSKKELDEVKNLAVNLEKSLREEILNEMQISKENEAYREQLNSTANLNPQKFTEKIYTLEEVKKMKPDEFRKNQQAILEQFAAHKIK